MADVLDIAAPAVTGPLANPADYADAIVASSAPAVAPSVAAPDAVEVLAAAAAPFNPTPDEWVDIYSQEAKAKGAINPFTDWTSDEISKVAADDHEFDVITEFQKYPELMSHPETAQKAIDAFKQVRARGFEFADIAPGKILGTAADVAKGFGKQIWNFGKLAATISPNALAVRGLPSEDEFQNRQREIAESWSGIESSVSELAETAKRGLGKAVPFVQKWGIGSTKLGATALAKATGIKSPENETPEESKKKFFDEIGVREQQEQILKGHGQFMQTVGGEVVKGLEEAGKPVRPEESTALAAGDPFTWWTYGKVFGAAGKITGQVPIRALPKEVLEIVPKAGGRTVQAVGKVAEVSANVTKIGAQAGAILYGAIQGGPLGALAGATGGTIVKKAAAAVGRAGAKVAEAGKQMATGEIVSPYAQLGRDVFETMPGALTDIGKGAAFDVGLAAATAETPQQTESVGLGVVFGALGGAHRITRHAVSGQIVAPRLWETGKPVPSSGKHQTYDAVHDSALTSATPGEQTRINAVRQFLKGAVPDADVFLLPRDEATAAKALESAGFSPADAAFYARQEGFFISPKPGERVIFVRNPSAAPHEAFHPIQDVIGEDGLRVLDTVTKADYAKDWEQQGERYANRLTKEPGQTWRDTILSKTGWGQKAGLEKLIGEIQARLVSSGTATTPEQVRQLAAAEWESRRKQVNYGLTPEEAVELSDRYLARELQAENFDVAFKHLGPKLAEGNSYPEKLARVVARFTSILGGEPLAGRRSEIGEIEPRFRTLEAVKNIGREPIQPGAIPPEAGLGVPPKIPPPPVPGVPPKIPPPAPPAPAPEVQAAKDWIDANPAKLPTPEAGAAAKTVADALATRTSVRVSYWAAKGTPAGESTSLRPERRAEIEAQRGAANEDRQLVEHEFTPYRVEVRSTGPQFVGWSRDILNSNIAKFSEWAKTVKDKARIPHETDANGLTETGVAQLREDARVYQENQANGYTGTGEKIVVPPEAEKLGAFKPEEKGEPLPIPQERADVINYLFNTKIPESAGRLAPLHLAGQEVSAATKPGRVEIPVRPRGEYSEATLRKADIMGPKGVREVNPFRQWVESQPGEKPSLIEVNQRLNLARIEEAAPAAGAEPVKGNILTQAAGFQPKPLEPRAIKESAVKDNQGRIFSGRYHGEALDKGEAAGAKSFVEQGFVTNEGEFLSREAAHNRAVELKQISAKEYQDQMQAYADEGVGVSPREMAEPMLETTSFSDVRQFQPKPLAEEVAGITKMTPEEWRSFSSGYKSEKYGAGLTGWAFDRGAAVKDASELAALRSAVEVFSAAGKEAMASRNMDAAMDFMTRSQAMREAYEAATGRTLDGTKEAGAPFIREHYDPDYQPPMAPKGEVKPESFQTQPKPGEELKDAVEKFSKVFESLSEKDQAKRDKSKQDLLRAVNPETLKANEATESMPFQAQPPAKEFETSETVSSELEKIRAGKIGGQTFDSAGQVWIPPKEPVDLVSMRSVNIPLSEATPENIAKALGPFAELLSEPDIATGVFAFSSGVNKLVSVDVNAGVPQKFRDNTTKFAKDNDQISFWDAAKFEEVKTGGKGETRLSTPEHVLLALDELSQGKPVDVEALVSGAPPPAESMLPGFESREYSRQTLTRAEKLSTYPEAVITRRYRDPVASEIEKSPLAKEAGGRKEAVEAFSRKIVEFAREWEDHPIYQSGLRWYSEFTPMLKKAFGKDAPVMAELLAATSPQRNPSQNFAYALEAITGWKEGRYDKLIEKYEAGLKKVEDGSWRDAYARDFKAGKVKNPPAHPSSATFLAHWMVKHKLTPTGMTGKQFGLSSDAVLKVLTRRWLSDNQGPKTLNFVMNLLGTGKEATVDVWADRTMRRIGYEGFKERWRILPENTEGVSNADFKFSQEAFRDAAEKLGVDPAALQGALWFAEKQLWADRGWGKLDLGDYRAEIKKVGMLSRGVQHRKEVAAAQAKEKESEQLEIKPR